jgi:hypothetical protein
LEIESDRTCDKLPIVTLRGSDRIEINSFDDYREFGAIASDAEDGKLTIDISNDLANESGTYSVTYSATDSAGNTVSVDRIVVIGETTSADNPDLDDADSDNNLPPISPTIALPVDFEKAADAYEISGFDGGVASVEVGPDAANSLKYVKGAGQNWAGVWINLDTALDAANGEIVTADVHSTEARDITLKFDAANVERVVSHGGTGWESLSYDFTGAMPADQTKIAFFNDLSQQGDGTDAWTIYIDNLAQTSVAPGPVDSDNDGVNDDEDAFPNDASETSDSDNDGTGDNADAFPNDDSETTDTDNADAFPNNPSETTDGDNDGVGANADFDDNEATITVESEPSPPTLAASTQHVYLSLITRSEDGTQETVVVTYNADAVNTGLGLRIHFDSSQLSVANLEDVLPQDNIFSNDNAKADISDFDNDTSTDSFIDVAWASLFGGWPAARPATLATVTFDIAEGATGSTVINFSASSNAAGFAFEGTNHILVISSNL